MKISLICKLCSMKESMTVDCYEDEEIMETCPHRLLILEVEDIRDKLQVLLSLRENKSNNKNKKNKDG